MPHLSGLYLWICPLLGIFRYLAADFAHSHTPVAKIATCTTAMVSYSYVMCNYRIQSVLNKNESLQPKMAYYFGYVSELCYGDVLPWLLARLHYFGIEIGCCREVFIQFTALRL